MSADRVLDAHLRYMTALTERGGGTVTKEGGFAAFAGIHPLPFLFNSAVRADRSLPAADLFDRAAEFFAGRSRTAYSVMALQGRDEDVLAEAKQRGLDVPGPDPLQSLDQPLPPATDPLPDGVDLRWASDDSDVTAIVEIALAAHRVYGFPDDVWPAAFGRPETILSEDLGVAIASRGGQDIASGQCHLVDGTAYIGWIAVVPEAGRAGLGTLITRRVIEWGFERGADSAVLMASPMGAPVYRRMGFQDVGGLHDISVRAEGV